MQLPHSQTEALTELALTIRGITANLLNDFAYSENAMTVPGTADVLSHHPNTRLLLLQEGHVNCHLDGKLICRYEPGDLLGLGRVLSLPGGILSSDEAIVVQPLERDALIAHIGADESLVKIWSYYLIAQLSWHQQCLAQEIRSDYQPNAGFMHFKSGDTIITQGDEAELVYTLLEGTAEALCDGVKVGDIHPDEIFGALAVFTRQKRMASVVATSDCTVLTVRKHEFIELIEHQPHICVGLIEEMASKINQLNGQLLRLQEHA